MCKETRRGLWLACAVVGAVAFGRGSTVQAGGGLYAWLTGHHTIPRETLAKDYRTGDVYYAPPIPYGEYVKDYTGAVHAAAGMAHGLISKVCHACSGLGCGLCGGLGSLHGNACGGCGGDGVDGHGHGCGNCRGTGILSGLGSKLCGGCGGHGMLANGSGCGGCGGHGLQMIGEGQGKKHGLSGLFGHRGGHGNHGAHAVLPSQQMAPSAQALPSVQGTACGTCRGSGRLGGGLCGSCGGLGKLAGLLGSLCGGCGGRGLLGNGSICGGCNGHGMNDACGSCGGTGSLHGGKCGACGGTGHLAKLKGAVQHVAGIKQALLYKMGIGGVEYFVGPGGPVPLTPGYVPYVVPVRSPRDFFAFPPFSESAGVGQMDP